MILGAIDIGSNAARLLIVDAHFYKNNEVDYTKLNLLRIPLRLGFDVFEQGYIGIDRQNMTLATMHAFAWLMKVYEVQHYKAVATSALRDASNGTDIVQQIELATQLKLDIITGDEEANIIYQNHAEQGLNKNVAHLYIDVGGGSTELNIYYNDVLVHKKSFDIGTIRLLKNTDTKAEWEALKQFVKTNTKNFKHIDAIGSGGNINKIYNLHKGKKNAPITTEFLHNYLDKLAPLSVADRMHEYNLKEDRADVIVPALQIFTAICRWGNITNVHVPQIGVADGIIKMLYKQHAQVFK
jgi:exopolyphosphatase / guanosine-5'-triphosphate,3'-diphosphate pyrophosphatase